MDNNKPLENQNSLVPAPGSQPSVTPQTPGTLPPLSEPPPVSTVVVPEKRDKLPFWFYILFAVVAVVFLSITFLLTKTLLEKSNKPPVENIIPTPEPTVKVPPTVIPTPQDSYLESINTLNDSDETASIEADLESTDTREVKNDFSQLEKETL